MKQELIVDWCNRIIRLGFYGLFAIIPLLVTPWNYELFEFNKMMATYGLTTIIVGAWLIQSFVSRRITLQKTPLDIPILLFVTSHIVATLASIDPHVSWFGYYSRFNGGMFSVLCYVLLYYAFVNNFEKGSKGQRVKGSKENLSAPLTLDTLTQFLKVALITATIVSIYAVLERFGIDKHLWVQDVQNRVFSTLGQPNWLAAYLVALIPIAIVFALKTQNTKLNDQQGRKNWILSSVFWSLIAGLFFLVLLFTKSRSGFLGFAISQAIFWFVLFFPILTRRITSKNTEKTEKNSPILQQFLLFSIVVFMIVFVIGTPFDQINKWVTLESWKSRIGQYSQTTRVQPTTNNAQPSSPSAPLLETGGTESGEIRSHVWQAAITAWQSSRKTMLVGTGTETFAFTFFRFRPAGHNMTSEWDFLYNKAHNEYLNFLATTGIFGLGSYLLFIGVFILWFLRQSIKVSMRQNKNPDSLTPDTLILPHALFAGWISILITNFFGFSVVTTQLFLFLFPAMVFVSQNKTGTFYTLQIPFTLSRLFLVLLLPLVLFILFVLSQMWWADTWFATGYRQNRAENFDRAQKALVTATKFNPGEPFYHDELASAYSGLSLSAFQNKESSLAASFAALSIKANDTAIKISPENVNFWKTRTKIFYALSNLEPQLNAMAIQSLERALELSPKDPKILYNLAILYGREAKNDHAIALLQQATTLKPNYRDAFYALWVFFTELQKPSEAKKILEQYLNTVDPNDKDFQEKIKI